MTGPELGAIAVLALAVFVVVVLIALLRAILAAPGHFADTRRLLEDIRDRLPPPR